MKRKAFTALLGIMLLWAPCVLGDVQTVVIVFTANLNGRLDPCGCEGNPMGGLSRRAEYLKQLRDRGAQPLVLDAGDLFAEGVTVEAARMNDARKAAEFIAQTYRSFGTAAIAVGDQDLALGLDYLRQLGKDSELDFLLSNLIDAEGSSVFSESKLVQADDASIGLIALLDPTFPLAEVHGDLRNFKITDPIEAARNQARKLIERGAEIIVVLSQMGEGYDHLLARQVEEIDVILSGHYPSRRQPYNIGGTLIAGAFREGQYVLELWLYLHGKRPYRFPALGWGTKSPPGRSTTYAARLVPIGNQYPENEELALARSKLGGPPVVAVAPPTLYAGKPGYNCIACHKKIVNSWLMTDHARAYITLADERAEFIPGCVRCHSTAYRQPGGPQTFDELPPFTAVGCESCHGPARGHKTAADAPRKAIRSQTCTVCHDSENSPGFNYRKYLKKVAHPD
jgi:Cytochrome c554 and c-prime